LISGSGSNLQSIIDSADKIKVEIACVISNNPAALGLKRAKNANIPTCVIEHKNFVTRELFDKKLAEKIQSINPKLIILAGFMRILSTHFVSQFSGKIINIHPSLLPKFKGLDTHQRALDAKETHAGASVHFVTPELDDGKIILQKSVVITPKDDAKSLAAKVLKQEHILYPKAIQKILENL
jgi:phosphoribosylglycinamide formyltransferase-1